MYSRMSALSSATRMRARRRRADSARASRGAARPVRRRQPAQRLLDVRRRARSPSTPCARAAPTRSAGRCATPSGSETRERRALRRARSSTRTVPPCSRDQLLHQRQPDARALVRARARALDAVEALEQRGSSSAGMPMPVSRPCSSTSRRATPATRVIVPVERELERVREQVEDDLLPHVAVDVDRLGQRRAVDVERAARRARSPSGTRWRGRR